MITATYLDCVLDLEKHEKVIKNLKELIVSSGVEFDSIAFCGTSGSLVAPFIAKELHKTLILVRKEQHHSSLNVEGNLESKSFIIIDDLIESGKTMQFLLGRIRSHHNLMKATCPGIFLYRDSCQSDKGKFTLTVPDGYLIETVNVYKLNNVF
jgi:adenine/guanine phosphoribosyltransferase-like PRPP-binding protein